MVNASTATARHIVQTLLRFGVEHVVVAPGSRSAPLALAVAQAADVGKIQLHVRIDERDAGFLALGLAKASGKLVPIIVTSGTAVANLYPAVVEAYHSAIPLVVLSADRPASSRGKSAPQIIDQAHLFGHFAKASIDLEPDVQDLKQIDQALRHSLTTHHGPVHINVQFDVPLVPDSNDLTWEPQVPAFAEIAPAQQTSETLELPSHGVIVAGSIESAEDTKAVKAIAHTLGWPIISEPSANVHDDAHALAHGVLILASGKFPKPEAVLTFGTVGLSRPVLQLLRDTPLYLAVHCAGQGPDIPDPVQCVQRVIHGIPQVTNTIDPQWLGHWKEHDHKVSDVVTDELRHDALSGPTATTTLWNHIPDQSNLVVAASWPVRHIEAFAAARQGIRVLGNRGVNGIDGLNSTAWGVATATLGRTYLLVGDIAFLHDIGGLNVSETELKPDLTIVVLDNDGGGIFSQLEQGAPEYSQHFERIFGTPHGKDLWQISESFGIASTRVTTRPELETALKATDKIPGVHVIICMTGSRSDEVALIKKIANRISEELA